MSDSIQTTIGYWEQNLKDIRGVAKRFPDAQHHRGRLFTVGKLKEPASVWVDPESKNEGVYLCVASGECLVLERSFYAPSSSDVLRDLLKRRPDVLADVVAIVRVER